jgi:YD repeat-containing protein
LASVKSAPSRSPPSPEERDDHDRLRRQWRPAHHLDSPGGSSPLQYRTTTSTYGDSGHPGDITAVTDPDGRQWLRSYDVYGDLASTTDPVGDVSTYTYNSDGWLQTMVSPRGNVAGGNPAQFTTAYSYSDPVIGATDQFGDVRWTRSA